MPNFIEKLKEIRSARGFNARELAEQTGIPEHKIRDIERGKVKISSETAKIFEEKLQISTTWLLFDEGEMLLPDIEGAKHKQDGTISIPRLSIRASAGRGNTLDGIDSHEDGSFLVLDRALFRTLPKKIKAVCVDGYSMIPMLLPDSWVIFSEADEYSGEGLYVIRWSNELIVKLLQRDRLGSIDVISVNPQYKSWRIEPDDQEGFAIIGKVIRIVL